MGRGGDGRLQLGEFATKVIEITGAGGGETALDFIQLRLQVTESIPSAIRLDHREKDQKTHRQHHGEEHEILEPESILHLKWFPRRPVETGDDRPWGSRIRPGSRTGYGEPCTGSNRAFKRSPSKFRLTSVMAMNAQGHARSHQRLRTVFNSLNPSLARFPNWAVAPPPRSPESSENSRKESLRGRPACRRR